MHRLDGGGQEDGDTGCLGRTLDIASVLRDISRFLALLANPAGPRIKVPSALVLFPCLHLSSSFKLDLYCLQLFLFSLPPSPNGTPRKSYQCSLQNVFTASQPGPNHHALSPGLLQLPASASKFLLHTWGVGGRLFNRKLHYVIPSPLVAPPLSKARSCTIQPCISSPPTRPPFTLLHTGPLTVSWDYQAHPHLRTFALTVSRFRNGLALNGRMAHFLYIFTYVDFSIKSSFPPAPKLRLMPTLRIPLFCVGFPPQHLSKMLCILSSLLSPPLILQAHEGCRFYLFSPLPSL